MKTPEQFAYKYFELLDEFNALLELVETTEEDEDSRVSRLWILEGRMAEIEEEGSAAELIEAELNRREEQDRQAQLIKEIYGRDTPKSIADYWQRAQR